MNIKSLTLATAATLAMIGAAEARDQIRIVGSSTVFPFSTAVAEQFGKSSRFATPIVESTGTGGGMKLFCSGVGEDHPDVTNASRRMKKSEFENCARNGVGITEVQIGFDGIVIANAKKGPDLDLTLEQLFLALAKEIPQDGKLIANPNKMWSDIDPSLPQTKIEVLGPPPTSGTRDAFVEIAMEGGCKALAGAGELGLKKKACHAVREDGGFHRSWRERQPDRPEARGQSGRIRHLRIQLPRSELRQGQRCRNRPHHARVRRDCRRHLSDLPLALLLRESNSMSA